MAPFFSPSPQVAFGMELNALSDDRTPFPHAVTMIMKGLTEMRIPFVKVCVLLASVLSHVQLEPLPPNGAGVVCGPYVTGKTLSEVLFLQHALR